MYPFNLTIGQRVKTCIHFLININHIATLKKIYNKF